MSPEKTLFTLTIAALSAAGFLYGDYWKKAGGNLTGHLEAKKLRSQNTTLITKNDELQDEVAQLRSIISEAPYPIPEDLIQFTEKDLGLVFLRAPHAKLSTLEERQNAAQRNLNSVYKQDGLALQERAWELLGLLPAAQNLESQWITIHTVGSQGIFDLKSGHILLAKNYQITDTSQSGLLIRLLVRQLLHQNYPPKFGKTEDAWNAWNATFQGAAINTEARYLQRRAADPKSTEDEKLSPSERTREDILQQLSPAIQGLANFPYLEGNQFILDRYIQSRNALREAFQNPPTQTLSLITSDKTPSTATEITFEDARGETNNIGALGLRLLLDLYLGMNSSSELSSTWRNDLFLLENDHLTWHLELNTQESAQKIFELFSRDALPTLKRVQENRNIEVKAEGTRFTFTNTPKTP